MKYQIEVPGQPVAAGDYLDEMEARSVVRRSGLVKDMGTVKVTPLYAESGDGEAVTADAPRKVLDTATVLADLAAWWSQASLPFSFSGSVPRRIAGGKHDQQVPDGTQNPYWEIIRQLPLDDIQLPGYERPEPMLHWHGGGREDFKYFAGRFDMCGTYAWSICSPGDITWLREILGGRGVVEPGAGGGYWAWQMEQAGIDVVAYEPRDLADNGHVRREWAALLRDDHSAPKRHPDRALFLCWPSYNEPWAAQSLSCYSGDLLIYAGEGQGGCTADDEFFELRDAGWEEISESPKHVSYWGIHCHLTAYRRKDTL
jgi:hypothetical protein